MSGRIDIDKLPRVIRGCMWDDGWEFMAPCVIYYPFFKSGDGGNTGHIYEMAEDVCCDISAGRMPDYKAMKDELVRECEWRGWSMAGFSKRQKAHHVELAVTWYFEDGELEFEIDSNEQFGPFEEKPQ